MNLNQISIKNFILALFKRDDGERILLGSGAYEFDADLQHFAANIIANDVIEKQGTDGQLLAGQVRRSAPQSFDGFVGDATTTREDTENYRRAFIRFFQPRHFYTVIYILPDGSAIQRKNGYLTDAPAVPEQYQRMPRYHVALAFEDLNYYSYAEDAQGEETYAQTVSLQPESELTGGLVWDGVGIEWTAETAGGRNLYNYKAAGFLNGYLNSSGTIVSSTTRITYIPCEPNTTYTIRKTNAGTNQRFCVFDTATKPAVGVQCISSVGTRSGLDTASNYTITTGAAAAWLCVFFKVPFATPSEDDIIKTIQIEKGSTAHAYEAYIPAGGAVWDAETGHATTTFTVNGLYAVNPIWTVLGPAESPLIENTTNGTSLSYLGQIPAGQSLIIDCSNQTATLAGANVKNNVRGTWQTFEPGQITIRYSGANITGPSNLKWNEVVG